MNLNRAHSCTWLSFDISRPSSRMFYLLNIMFSLVSYNFITWDIIKLVLMRYAVDWLLSVRNHLISIFKIIQMPIACAWRLTVEYNRMFSQLALFRQSQSIHSIPQSCLDNQGNGRRAPSRGVIIPIPSPRQSFSLYHYVRAGKRYSPNTCLSLLWFFPSDTVYECMVIQLK